MLRQTHQWDIRCPKALVRMFPRAKRKGYYYKVTRDQAQRICNALSAEYGVQRPVVSVEKPEHNGCCRFLPKGNSFIDVHARGHIKTVFHEWYHHLEYATNGKYNSSDRQGGDTSLAWQFADKLFEVFRRTYA